MCLSALQNISFLLSSYYVKHAHSHVILVAQKTVVAGEQREVPV